MTHAEPAQRLTELLGLTEPPVAVCFDSAAAARSGGAAVPSEPAGCCFWEPARHRRLDTVAADHANCSVGSYTHGLIPLHAAAAGADTAALVESGWVGEADLQAAPTLPFTPASITYLPLTAAEAVDVDVVLIRLSPAALTTLMGAAPDIALTGKPQCAIVPLAHAGRSAVSPGCAVSRVRTGQPADVMTCAVPATALEELVRRLEASTESDRIVAAFAAEDRERFVAPTPNPNPTPDDAGRPGSG